MRPAVVDTSGVRVAGLLKALPCQLSARLPSGPLPADSAGVGMSMLANTRASRAGSADRWASSDLIMACSEQCDHERTALSAGVKGPPGTQLRRLLRGDHSEKGPGFFHKQLLLKLAKRRPVTQQLPNSATRRERQTGVSISAFPFENEAFSCVNPEQMEHFHGSGIKQRKERRRL